jgi:hypothetical protein
MPDVNAEQRQQAKTAANLAVVANDTAVVLGAAGAIIVVGGVASGVGSLGGVLVGGTLGVCSFAAWFIGNRYQRLANDPPRGDFNQLSTSTAFIVEQALPADEPDATVARFAAQQVILVDAVDCLVTSLERFDGATNAGDFDIASSQADAVQQNAQAVIAAHDTLRALADPINQAWAATSVDWDAVALDEVQQAPRDAIGDPARSPGGALQGGLATVADLTDPGVFAEADVESPPLLTATDKPAQPDALVDFTLLDELDTESDPLRDLVVADNV